MAHRSCIAVAALVLLLACGGADAAAKALSCSTSSSGSGIVDSIQTKLNVSCPANCKAAGGSIWGTGVYTSDSPICRAAIHAGVITNAKGGHFIVYYAKGRASYTGSSKNGITSSNYGQWESSITFTGPALFPSITCDKTNSPTRDVVGTGKGVPYPRTSLTLDCPGGCIAPGTTVRVWGSGAYTSDSKICQAAIHAGVIKPSGGRFTIYDYPGMRSYRGSTFNGVATLDFGSWTWSYRFKPLANLTCATTNGQGLVNANVTTRIAVCPSTCYEAGGDIFGTSTYRQNSRICRAAIHAGVINTGGGEVIIRYVPGLASYKGTTANFVTSKNATGSPGAFKFV